MITEEVVEAACEGDLTAQKTLFNWLYNELAPVVRARVPDPDQEDVHHRALHDVLRKMHAHAPREVEPFRQWAISYAHKAAQAYWGRRKRKAARIAAGIDVDAWPRESTSVHSRWHRGLLLRLLSTFLRRLSRRYRSPLQHRMRGGNDSSFARARALAKPTVRWRRHEGRKRLQAMFEDYLSGEISGGRQALVPESSS